MKSGVSGVPEQSGSIRVTIYDRVYSLQSTSGEESTRRLAQAVDATMRHIADKTHTFDSLGLAVLAALHFADECERLRERYETLKGMVTEKSLQFREVLDDAVRKPD